MKRVLSGLLMLACINIQLVAKEGSKKDIKNFAVSCSAQQISAPTTITAPGPYCVTNNITGDGMNPAIIIDSDNVILNLNGYLIDGNGNNAIYMNSHKNVTIKNGSVTTSAGGVGITALASNGVIISNLQAYNGDVAIELLACKNSKINSVKVFNNTNTVLGSAVLHINACSEIELFDVQVNNNIKAFSSDDTNHGIVTIISCNDVTLTNCTVNGNVQNNDIIIFAPLFICEVNGIKLSNCHVNGNSVSVATTKAFTPIMVDFCSDVVMSDCQVVQNEIPVSGNEFRPIYLAGVSRTIIENCLITDNNAATLSEFSAIFCEPSLTFDHSDFIINGCQLCGNTVADLSSGGALTAIHLSGMNDPARRCRTLITDCQVNDNVVNSTINPSQVIGIGAQNIDDLTIANTTCNGNRGASESYGILVIATGTEGDVHKTRILNSTASDNSSQTFACGIFLAGPNLPPSTIVDQSEIIGCQAHRNIPNLGSGMGIVLQNTSGCSLLDCKANENGTTGFYLGSPVESTLFSANTVNESAVIRRCIANNNVLNGFTLANDGPSKNRSCFLQKNTAIKNGQYGYYHTAGDILRSAFLSNYAKGNQMQNYFISGGVIQIRSLSLTTGKYTPISGGTKLSALVNIEAVN